MAVLVGIFLLAALLSFPLVDRLGRDAFLLLALVPTAGLAYSLALTPRVLAGDAPVEAFSWMPGIDLDVVFRMDVLSWLMTLLVCGVGALVFVYCARYFAEGEPRLGRFAAVLMAFAGMMYGLVVADELMLLFVFWEGTTVFSYLLIGQYYWRQQSRRAALQALVVTTTGGLAMLVGMVLLTVLTGTGRISEIVAAGWTPDTASPAMIWAIMLILVGAVSKSALLPFHFWLPGAMAAPTPVSAYLHAAAMVKGGIYLVLRFSPGFSTMPGYVPVLVGLGVATMLLGGWQSLKQFDLKLLLAYGTVSQLGFLMIMGSFGTPDVMLAALALLLAHALFKSTLFLVVGIIDHKAGTRDLRKLSGFGKDSPVLCTIAVLAAASMAGVPPLMGFVAKESIYTSLLDAGTPAALVALIGVFAGSVLTVAYSARFVWGAFASKPGVDPVRDTEKSRLFVLPPAVLGLLCLVTGLAAPLVDPVLAAYADTMPGGPTHEHLALWHGLGPALGLTVLTLAAGLALFRWRDQVSLFQVTLPDGFDFHTGYRRSMAGLERFAAWITARTQTGSMPFYQGVIYLVAILAVGTALVFNDSWPRSIDFAQSPSQVVVAAMLITSAIAATLMRKRFASAVVVGIAGYGMVAFYAFQGAPDLALTQILVETITLVVFVLVLRRLPSRMGHESSRLGPSLRAVIGIAFGLLMMVVAAVALAARNTVPISAELPSLAYLVGHGKNVVNVMLVDIRAWDTLGETSVVVVAATGIASLLYVRSREGKLQRHSALEDRPSGFSRLYETVDDTVASPTGKVREDAESRRGAWLLAGQTLAPQNRSIILEVTVRLLFHIIVIYSVYLLFAGHNLPGGGFAAGLVAGLAFFARYLAGGRFELAEAAPFDVGRVLGIGTILVSGTALAGFVWGDTVLQSRYWEADLPVLGHVSFGTSTIFDIGVYLIVIGLMLDIVRGLGAEVDRQQEVDEQAVVDSFETSPANPDTSELHHMVGRIDDVDLERGGGAL